MSRLASEIRGEIASIVNFLTEKGLAIYSRQTYSRNYNGITEVGWSQEGPNISIALKNLPYKDIYGHLLNNQQYNFVLSDGALIQLLYKFNGNQIIEHRLGFFPAPNINESDIIADDELGTTEDFELNTEGDLDTSLISQDDVDELNEREAQYFDSHPPIRIDYTPAQYQAFAHSETHIHLGHSKECRIPASAPVGPSTYTLFILRSFYSDRIDDTIITKLTTNQKFKHTLKPEESGCVHFNIPSHTI